MFTPEGFDMRSRNQETIFSNWTPSSRLSFWVGVGGVVVGITAGVFAGANPLCLGLVVGAVAVVVYFFANFEQTVLGLLILRSSLDIFTFQQIPAVFGIGLDVLTLLYVTVLLLTGRPVRTDWFWWFFAGWLTFQGFWLILLPLGGLGLNTLFLPASIREWLRLFSWLMVYLLVMQLKDQLHPKQIISLMLLSLIPPVTVALLQIFLPSVLPPVLLLGISDLNSVVSNSRIQGTFGHPNSFAVYLLLFIGLAWWKLGQTQHRWFWLLLLGLLAFLLVGTKTLVALVMLGVLVLVLTARRLNLPNLISGVLLFALVLVLFANTELGQQRLSSLADTPLLNPEIDTSRAILLSTSDYNSFNWRIAQWTELLQAWQQFPLLGYGLGLSMSVSANHFLPHNDYIRALVEQGLVGLVILLSMIGVQGVRLVQLLRRAPCGSAQHNLCLILLAILIGTFIGMLTENIWSCTAFFFYWWSLVAVAGWDWKLQTSNNPMPNTSH